MHAQYASMCIKLCIHYRETALESCKCFTIVT